ncbi:MAG: (d)CMP kinase [Flavobacteriaceae bacterium]|nr:(d)CMP kinase [Flavobacteriaceae bacterium]
MDNIIIAIDGYASTGKSSLAKAIAKHLNFVYVDSGSMYRAITYYALKNNLIPLSRPNLLELKNKLSKINLNFVYNKELGFSEIFLNNKLIEKEIRSVLISKHVSSVAALPFVRRHMVSLQKKISLNKGVVMDGRDIGTVVFPEAELKLFLSASAEIRAKRRYDEYVKNNINISLKEVLSDLQSRDLDDSTREDSPLIIAKDAIEIDNSEMSIKEQLNYVISILSEKFNL